MFHIHHCHQDGQHHRTGSVQVHGENHLILTAVGVKQCVLKAGPLLQQERWFMDGPVRSWSLLMFSTAETETKNMMKK